MNFSIIPTLLETHNILFSRKQNITREINITLLYVNERTLDSLQNMVKS